MIILTQKKVGNSPLNRVLQRGDLVLQLLDRGFAFRNGTLELLLPRRLHRFDSPVALRRDTIKPSTQELHLVGEFQVAFPEGDKIGSLALDEFLPAFAFQLLLVPEKTLDIFEP